MRIVQKTENNIISIYFIEAGEEQFAGTIIVCNNGFKVEDIFKETTMKKTKNEALDWLLIQSGYDI